ncbi:MAG: Conserved rane protein [Proteobacteria bacterium]|nr:Conserved rane protein [Pseudomonadota bacterium]
MQEEFEYVGFWARVGASLVDSVLLLVIIVPILVGIYGWAYFDAEALIQGPADFLLSWIFPAVLIILFWLKRQATPGKDAVSAMIVDAKTGEPPTTTQLVIRYLGYYVSTIPLGLGLIWVAFDARKQGWHDKMAGTVVIRRKKTHAPEA